MATPNSLTNLDDEYSFLRPYLEEEEKKQKEEELSEEYSFLAPYMEKPKVAEPVAPKEEITEEYEFLRPYMEQSAPARAPSLIRAEAPTLESLGVTLPQPPPPKEGILRQAADLPVQFAIGINNSVKALTDLFGADNEVSQNLNQNVDWYRSLLSASSKQDEEEIGRILQDAEGKGMLGQLAAGLEAFTVAPADFVASGLGSLATFAATGLAGRAAAAARIAQTGVTGAKALATTERVVRGAQVATGMGMGAGIVKGQIYESVKEEMLAQGKTEEQARQVALEAQSYDGKNLPSILLGAGLGALDAFTGAEKVIGKILTKGGIAPNASRIGNIIKNGLTEGAPEFIQAAQEKLASNIALRNEGVEVGLTDGVFAQGALEGLVGVGMGLGAGAIEPRTQPATKEEVVAAAAETQSVARQSSNIAPETASLVEGQAEKVIQGTETPDEKVARLQREAQEAAGEIELEEEPSVSGLPPERIKSARWFESAARNRLKELQDKDDAGVEDFTTQERDEFEFLKTSPTPEQIAERYGYGVAPAVEPTAVTTTTQPTTPAVTEPAPVEPEPTLTPPPTTVPADTLLRLDTREELARLVSGGMTREEAIADLGKRRKEEKQVISDSVNIGDEVVVTINEKLGISVRYKIVRGLRGGKAVQKINERGAAVGPELSLDAEAGISGHSDIAGGQVVRKGATAQPATTTPTVAPPVEAAVAPVEPVVPVEGARPPVTPEVVPKAENAVVEAEQKSEQESDTVKVFRGVAEAGALPTGGAFFTDSETDASAYAQLASLRKAVEDNEDLNDIVGEIMAEEGANDITDLSINTIKNIIEGNNIQVGDISEGTVLRGNVRLGNVLNLESFGSEVGSLPETWNQLNELGLVAETWQSLDEDVQAELQDKYRGKAFYSLLEKEVNLNDQFAKGVDTIVFTDQNTEGKGTHRTYLTKAAEQFAQEAAPAAVEPTPVTPTPVTPEAPTAVEPPALAPLRRVVKAEQTEEDVSGLVGQGLVELYNGQPVLTQAGLEALPEAERPRLTPEARKIQIDTRTSEPVAEAISKNLRIGVDQVPVDVRMPDGWTLVGDVYVPPQPQAVAPAPTPEVREARREPAITPQQDRDYLDAVERGDLDAASRVVEDAAKASGRRNESGAVIDLTTGRVIEESHRGVPVSENWQDNVRFGEAAQKSIVSGDNPIGIAHTHPDESGLSDNDWRTLGWSNVKVIQAVTPSGEVFTVRKPDGARATPNQIIKEWNKIEDDIFESGRYSNMTVPEIVDEINSRLAEVLGFSYSKQEARLHPLKLETIVRDDAGNIIPPSQRFQQGEADIRYNPLGYDITNVVEDIKAGRTDGPLRAVNNVVKEATAFRDRVKAEAERRQRPRARGKAAILERIARERSSGKLSEETAQALTDFVNSIREEAIGDTAISIKGAGAASNFDFGQSLVTFFLTQDQPKVGARVGIHEFWHGLSRFLPKTEAEKMAKDYTKALSGYLKDNPWFLAFVGRYSLTPEQFEEYKFFNPKEAETKLVPVQDSQGNIVKYQIKYDAENYRYIMLDEWIAEKMTDLVESRQAMPNTFMGKLAKIIKEFLAQIQAKLGRDVYQSFYNLVTDPNQKIDLQRMGSVARPFQIYQPQDYNYAEDISDQIRYAMRQREDINQEYTPNTDEERKAFEKATYNKVLARNPQLAVAAVRLKNGQITAGEYADLVDSIDPFVPKGADPIPTDDKIKQYIQSDKAGKVGLVDENGNQRLEAGSEYEFRIDIPTYNRSTAAGDTVYAITAHLPVADTAKTVGEVAAFTGIAKVTDPRFMTRDVREGGAITIAMGAGKFRLATVKGNYEPITDLPSDINDPNVWTEVGYNPVRSSFFVDTRSKQAVVGGSEAIMVGSRVFVKNAQIEARPTGITYGKAYNPLGLDPEPTPSFAIDTPEAKTLSNLKASMEKVDGASEAKGGKPETQKVSEIAANWMESGGDERALQDAITENTNLSPANAAKVAKVIAKQYDIQQSIATAFLETQTGLSVEALPEGVTLPKEVDPDRPKPVMQRLFDVFMGVRVPPVKIEVNEKTALKQQIRLKAAANRAAKAEQKRTAEEVVEIIKAMELLGPVRPKQVQALAKRAARVIWTNEKSVEAFSEYAAKVVENANYDADLREAKAAQKRAKQLSTQKKVAMGPQREVLEDVSKVPVNKLDDPRMFAEAVNYYLRGFKSVLSPDYVVIPDAEMESYLSGAQSEAQRNQRDLDREANRRLAEKYGIDPDQVNEMMESIDIIKQIEAQENREALENLLTEKAVETQQGLKGYNTDSLRADQRSIVSSMLKVDPKALDPEERQRFIRITNNIIYNNQTNGAEYFVAVAKGQQSAREAAQDSTMVAKNRAWINLLPRFVSERMQRGWALELQSISDTFRNAFGKGAMAKMYDAMGMLDLNLGFTKANNTIDQIQEKIAEFHRNLEKKYKSAARNQDGLLAEGVVGFLIQSVPKKDEVTSINQRRDLIRQDIANRRRSTGEPDKVAMADRIETILNRIDGESVEAILNNMKREFPANHESLVWYKDTLLPQYKDFLKSFDENFNDQANNYENPNYLTIGFTSAGPSLAITPEEQGLFYDQVSLRPKQSAYTIKRVDYTELPKDRTTGKPKEIEFNLRRNVFNGLSDQINKAYTSSAWQRIASFMKTPEAEIVFGGAANKDFFIERLNRLRLSRMRRGSMGSGGAIEKAVDSLSVISRKLGTGIALGGVYQWIKQPPDQLITAWGSGGRADLLSRNIAPSTQKAARELLNKFSIGRRGDASAGYKYINQMEGHQNRLERYFSESKWEQAKEQAGKIADVWMVALKSSDFLAASAAWMTYYEGELNKQDIKIDDWSKEASLIESDPARRQAAAFAEQMTDIYQGSSDPTSMATFAQSGKTGWENLVKAIFVPFNSFAIQQRMRLYSDARDAINGSKSGAGGLAGTIGGLILFHATKRYAIPAISGAGIGVLYGLMGVDMEEPDEEKQKEEANKNWRQFLADITGNLLVGGTPQIVESQFIDAMNRASYLVSLQLENDSILNEDGEIMSYDQYSKERSPFYRYKSFDNAMSLGMLEIGLGQAEQVALQTKMLATPEEMEMYTPEEQRLLYFSALSEWLLLMRLNDTDFARLVGKARRDMIKAAEEREKEIKAIRSGR